VAGIGVRLKFGSDAEIKNTMKKTALVNGMIIDGTGRLPLEPLHPGDVARRFCRKRVLLDWGEHARADRWK